MKSTITSTKSGSGFWIWPGTFKHFRTASILQNSSTLGLAAAAKGFCYQLSEQQKVEIDFSHRNIPKGVPKEISLCLFRVLQEALRNAVQHSGGGGSSQLNCTEQSERFNSRCATRELALIPHDAINGHGLGLISMRERMQLVGGEFSFRSQPSCGTTVHARVPFTSGSDSVDANRVTAALLSSSVRMQSNSAPHLFSPLAKASSELVQATMLTSAPLPSPPNLLDPLHLGSATRHEFHRFLSSGRIAAYPEVSLASENVRF